MLKHVSHVNVWVHDQDEALAFFTEKLGLEVREDVTLEEFGSYRWLTVGPVGQPEVQFILSRPGPPAPRPGRRARAARPRRPGRRERRRHGDPGLRGRAGHVRRPARPRRRSSRRSRWSAATASTRRSAIRPATRSASCSARRELALAGRERLAARLPRPPLRAARADAGPRPVAELRDVHADPGRHHGARRHAAGAADVPVRDVPAGRPRRRLVRHRHVHPHAQRVRGRQGRRPRGRLPARRRARARGGARPRSPARSRRRGRARSPRASSPSSPRSPCRCRSTGSG